MTQLSEHEQVVEDLRTENTRLATKVADLSQTKIARNMAHLLDQVGTPGVCNGCGTRIYWVVHRNGKKVPYTPQGFNHFINCPRAKKFRNPKRFIDE